MSLDLVSSTFAAKTALSRFVHKEYPKTDASWFEKVVKWERSDEYIIDLIKKHSGLQWSPLTRVVIRNARIYERLVPGPSGHHYSFQEGRIPSSLKIMDSVDELFANVVLPRVPGTDRDWFIRVLVHAENEAHILKYMDQRRHIFDADDARDIILATRQLARYILKDMPVRRAFASVILLFVRIQVFGENRPDDTWFWDLMDGPKEGLFYLSTVWGYSGDALNFAWDVMHGKSVCWNRLHAFFLKSLF